MRQHRRGISAAAARKGVKSGYEFFQGKGLAQVVIRPEIKPFHPLLQSSPGRQNKHGKLPAAPPPVAQYIKPVHTRKRQIKNGGVILRRLRGIPACHAVLKPVHGKISPFKTRLDAFTNNTIIFNKKDSHDVCLFPQEGAVPPLPPTCGGRGNVNVRSRLP